MVSNLRYSISYAFMKESDDELMVASKNAVAYIKQVRGTFVLLADKVQVNKGVEGGDHLPRLPQGDSLAESRIEGRHNDRVAHRHRLERGLC